MELVELANFLGKLGPTLALPAGVMALVAFVLNNRALMLVSVAAAFVAICTSVASLLVRIWAT